MNEAAPPPLPIPNAAPHVTLSRQLWTGFLTLSLCCGAIGGIGALFLGDGLFKTGPDPAIHAPELQARLERVERAVAEKPDMQKFEQDLSVQSAQTAALQQQVQQIDQSKAQSGTNTTAQVLLGLTQLKNAYDNDLPFDTGLKTLGEQITQPQIKETLEKLGALTAHGLPTKANLLQDLQGIATAGKAPQAELMLPNQTFQERIVTAAKNFIQVRPTADVVQEGNVTSLAQAIQGDNLLLANNLLTQMPVSPATQAMAEKLGLRLQIQQMVQQLLTQIPAALSSSGDSGSSTEEPVKGSLY